MNEIDLEVRRDRKVMLNNMTKFVSFFSVARNLNESSRKLYSEILLLSVQQTTSCNKTVETNYIDLARKLTCSVATIRRNLKILEKLPPKNRYNNRRAFLNLLQIH